MPQQSIEPQLVTFNVNGVRFTTNKDVLTRENHTFFSGLLSEYGETDGGVYTIDRNPDLFEMVLDHMEGKDIINQISKLTYPQWLQFKHELQFFSISSMNDYFQVFVSGGTDGTIKVWSSATGACLNTISAHEKSVVAILRLTDVSVVSSGEDNFLKVWNIESGQCTKCIHASPISTLLQLSNNRIAGSCRELICVWDIESGELVKQMDQSATVHCLVHISDQTFASSSTSTHIIVIWDKLTLVCLRTLNTGNVSAGRFISISDGLFAVCDRNNSTVTILDSSTGHAMVHLSGHSQSVICIAKLSDEQFATGGSDRTIRIWHMQSSKLLEGHSDWVTCLLQVSENRMVSASNDGTLIIWNIFTGKRIVQSPQEHTVNALC